MTTSPADPIQDSPGETAFAQLEARPVPHAIGGWSDGDGVEPRLHIRHAQSYERLARAFSRLDVTFDSLSMDRYVQRARLADQQVVFTAEALPLNTAAAQHLCRDKLSSYQALASCGVLVPPFHAFQLGPVPAASAGTATSLRTLGRRLRDWFPSLCEGRAPVVVKPGAGSHGKGVRLCENHDAVTTAAARLLERWRYGIVQLFMRGPEYRVMVLDGAVVLAYLKMPPEVVGDGTSTLRELLAARCGVDAALDVRLDPSCRTELDSVPAVGRRVRVDLAILNLRHGATPSIGETPPDVVQAALTAHHALGLRFSGADVRMAPDGHAYILEVNANPGLDVLETYDREAADRVTLAVAKAVRAMLREAPREASPPRRPPP